MTFSSINPANAAKIADYETHDDAYVEAALAKSAAAFQYWKTVSIEDRATLMVRAAELLESEIPTAGALMTTEMGKTFAAAKGEASKCALTMRYYAEHAARMLADRIIETKATKSGVRYEPLGGILAVMPWNFPMWQVLRVAIPNLMAGNVMIVKHASNVPGTAEYIEDLFRRAGFPEGCVVNLFLEHSRVEAVIADNRVAACTVTGSERAGAAVAAAAGKYLKKVVLELGGSDPFVVGASADLDHTIPLAVTARLQNNGQACICAKRFIVVKDIAEEFIARFSEAMAQATTGDPMDPATIVGPLANKAQFDLLKRQVAESIDAGAVATTGGAPLEGPGYYFPPTVLVNVPAGTPASTEEIFGPVAVVHVADTLADAIAYANDTPWGLSGSIWATDPEEIRQGVEGLEVGIVFANAMVASMPELPFGGIKLSGFGRELGEEGIREFCNTKSYYIA